MSFLTHVEIHADDTERAVEFYSQVFGWTIQPKWAGEEEYWLIFMSGAGDKGINGGIRARINPKTSAVPQIQVDSIDESIQKVLKCGGKVAQPKKKIPGTGHLVYCLDTEGNLFALIEKNFEVNK